MTSHFCYHLAKAHIHQIQAKAFATSRQVFHPCPDATTSCEHPKPCDVPCSTDTHRHGRNYRATLTDCRQSHDFLDAFWCISHPIHGKVSVTRSLQKHCKTASFRKQTINCSISCSNSHRINCLP